MAVPDLIAPGRHRDLEGRGHEVWWRRGLIALICVFLVLGLLNVFGQRPGTWRAEGPAATVELYAPATVRSGLLFEARFTIHARDDLANALLLLSPGWNEGIQMNTIEPSPVGQSSRNGDLLFKLGHIAKGNVYRLFLEFQVNPTNVGRRAADVALYDGGRRLLAIHRTITVYP